MTHRNRWFLWAGIPWLAAGLAWGESPAPVPVPSVSASVPANPPAPAQGNIQGTQQAEKTEKPAPQSALSDAFIIQGLLRIYLDRPALVTVYNARGQQIFQMDSERALESVPLHGITTGFVYLTVRAGAMETTKKLVYTGK